MHKGAGTKMHKGAGTKMHKGARTTMHKCQVKITNTQWNPQ